MGEHLVENYQKQALMQQEWLEMWPAFEQEFAELPPWTQKIMIRDMNTAFKNRMLVIKKVKSLSSHRSIKDVNQPLTSKTLLPMETLVISKASEGEP